jgi:hypothetical protein
MRKMAGVLVAVMVLGLAGLALAGDAQDKYKDLDRLKDASSPVTVGLKQQSLEKTFEMLEKVAAIDIKLGAGFPTKKQVTRSWEAAPLKQVLVDLAEKYGLTYEVKDDHSLVVKGPAKL